jgi:hypothetical protein
LITGIAAAGTASAGIRKYRQFRSQDCDFERLRQRKTVHFDAAKGPAKKLTG